MGRTLQTPTLLRNAIDSEDAALHHVSQPQFNPSTYHSGLQPAYSRTFLATRDHSRCTRFASRLSPAPHYPPDDMRLRSPLAALTAAIINAASPKPKHVSNMSIHTGVYDEGSGSTTDENLSSSVITDQLFDMEFKPTLKLITKSIDSKATLPSHDVLMDMLDEEFDEELLELDEDEISSILSDFPLTPDGTGAFLLTEFRPGSDNDFSLSSFLSQRPEIIAAAEDVPNIQTACKCHLQQGRDIVISDRPVFDADHRSCEIEMAKMYISDLGHGKMWESTVRQGLPPRKDRLHHLFDEAPSKHPNAAPLSFLLIENQFAAAVNRAYRASGDTYQPFAEYRIPLNRERVVDFGVRRPESGSLNELRVEHARVYISRLLPFHPSH